MISRRETSWGGSNQVPLRPLICLVWDIAHGITLRNASPGTGSYTEDTSCMKLASRNRFNRNNSCWTTLQTEEKFEVFAVVRWRCCSSGLWRSVDSWVDMFRRNTLYPSSGLKMAKFPTNQKLRENGRLSFVLQQLCNKRFTWLWADWWKERKHHVLSHPHGRWTFSVTTFPDSNDLQTFFRHFSSSHAP
jgi:hypothetical protein